MVRLEPLFLFRGFVECLEPAVPAEVQRELMELLRVRQRCGVGRVNASIAASTNVMAWDHRDRNRVGSREARHPLRRYARSRRHASTRAVGAWSISIAGDVLRRLTRVVGVPTRVPVDHLGETSPTRIDLCVLGSGLCW